MQTITEYLAVVLPVVALFCVIFLILVNIYIRVRRLIPVKVNCWFCNGWTKVHYDFRNSFECPTCLQYNGFDSEGDYNKPISAQYDDLLNQDVIYNRKRCDTPAATNGLCASCNNNVRLKVFQLANFVPLNVNNYDAEIEHFEHQLNKSYQLCVKCELVVKNTLRKQNELLGLKLPKLQRRGLRLLDFNGFSGNKWLFVVKTIGIILIIIACCNIFYILSCYDYSNNNLKKILPQTLYPYALKLKKYYLNVMDSIEHFVDQTFPSNEFGTLWNDKQNGSEYNLKVLCCLGAFLQMFLLLLSNSGIISKIIQLVAWGILMWLSWTYPILDLNHSNYAQIILNVVILVLFCIPTTSGSKPRKVKRKLSHKTRLSGVHKPHRVSGTGPSEVNKITPTNQPEKHSTGYIKPIKMSTLKFPKSEIPPKDYSNFFTYNTNSILDRPLNLQEELVNDLTKLNLGRANKLFSNNYDNPFLKIRPPTYAQSNSSYVRTYNQYVHCDDKSAMPITPSSFTLKVRFSTHGPKLQ